MDTIVGHSANRCSSGSHCLPAGERHIRLFENVAGNKNNFVRIKLVGTTANRAAIGARVTAKIGDGVQAIEVDGGHGHYGLQNEQIVHVGLGAACDSEVTVRWPNADGTTQTERLAAGYTYEWKEGESPVAMQEP